MCLFDTTQCSTSHVVIIIILSNITLQHHCIHCPLPAFYNYFLSKMDAQNQEVMKQHILEVMSSRGLANSTDPPFGTNQSSVLVCPNVLSFSTEYFLEKECTAEPLVSAKKYPV